MIIKPAASIIQELDAASFTVIGSPGSDGQGVSALQTFGRALSGARGDFIVVLGDVSPLGRDPYYRTAVDFIERHTEKPVYVMPGNHDGPDYGEYFGCDNRAIVSEAFSLVMLDNSTRRFTDEALLFLRDALALAESPNVVVAFHVPPPNRISGDSMEIGEWARFEEAAGVWRKRISLLVAGHAHTCFEDEVDGLRLIVTGGGGSRMHETDRVVTPPHHVLEYRVDAEGKPRARMRRIQAGREEREAGVLAALGEAYAAECRAHVGHRIDAEDAARRGLHNLARLFRAAAESRLRHARVLRSVLRQGEGPLASVAKSLEEARRASERFKELVAGIPRDVSAMRALDAAFASETSYAGLFERAAGGMGAGSDIPEAFYHICRSCGQIYQGADSPTYCAFCGAPADRIQAAN